MPFEKVKSKYQADSIINGPLPTSCHQSQPLIVTAKMSLGAKTLLLENHWIRVIKRKKSLLIFLKYIASIVKMKTLPEVSPSRQNHEAT